MNFEDLDKLTNKVRDELVRLGCEVSKDACDDDKVAEYRAKIWDALYNCNALIVKIQEKENYEYYKNK